MNRQSLFLGSLALNIVLLIVIALPKSPTDDNAETAAPPVPEDLSSESQTATEPIRPPSSEGAPAQTAPEVAPFNWRMVESADYPEYIENLKRIGVPGETIADIIRADVEKLYASKMSEIEVERPKFEYWKTGNAFMGSMVGTSPEEVKARTALVDEREDLLKTLLGDLYVPPKGNPMTTMVDQVANGMKNVLDFLPESSVDEIMRIQTDFQTRLMEEMASEDLDYSDPDVQKRMADLRREVDEEIAALLTPEQKLEYDLRMSDTANMMRGQLREFDATEEEFREIFQLRKEYDDTYSITGAFGGTPDPAERQARIEAQTELQESIKDALGDERYAAYERSQDYSYQGMAQVARKFDLPQESAVQVYDIKKLTDAEVQRIRSAPDMTPAERRNALSEVQTQTQAAIQEVFGADAFENYSERGQARWLDRIAPSANPPQGMTPEMLEMYGFEAPATGN